MKDGNVQMLFECKKIGELSNINHASQLFRYFHATNARIGILTNGQRYKFFTDLDNKNKMDEKPFLELDLLEIDENIISELSKLTKDAFDVDSIVNAAGELKYIGQIKKIIAMQFSNPDEDLVKFFTQRVYEGINTQKIRDQFFVLTKKAMGQFLNDQINDRLKTALSGNAVHIPSMINYDAPALTPIADGDDIITTDEEIEAFTSLKPSPEAQWTESEFSAEMQNHISLSCWTITIESQLRGCILTARKSISAFLKPIKARSGTKLRTWTISINIQNKFWRLCAPTNCQYPVRLI